MSETQLFAATTFTEIYERVLVGPLFRPFAEQLVACVAAKPGDSVIDVACGTGIVARVARERLGPEARILGVDVAPAMLDVARLNAMAVIGMSETGKAMSEAERGELAGRIAADSQDVIARATKNGMFVLPLTTNIATARA